MDVRCDRCETEYELEDSSVSDAGTSVQCTTCGHRFIVTKSGSAPMPQAPVVTPAGGNPSQSVVDAEPQVPEWTLSTDNGKVHRFRDLNTLQKWIVERKVSRTDRLSRGGGPWLALGDMDELVPFFTIVDQADRARVPVRTPPPSQAAQAAAQAAQARRSSAGTTPQPPPPVPFDAKNHVSADGPTVPNRRLPDAGRVDSSSTTAKRPPMRTPGLGLQPMGATPSLFGGPAAAAPAAATGAPPSSSLPSAHTAPTVSLPAATATEATTLVASALPSAAVAAAGSGAIAMGASRPKRPGGPDSLRSLSTGARPAARTESAFPAGPLDENASFTNDLALPNNRTRNLLIAVVVIAAGAGGVGYMLWSQHRGPTASATAPAAADTAPVPPAPTANPAQAGGEAKTAAPEHPGAPEAAPPAKAENSGTAPTTTPAATGKALAGGARARAGGGTKGGDADGPGKGGGAGYDRIVGEADRLLERGQTAKAEKLYTQALAAKPDGAAALTGIAYVLLDRQRHFKAIETFRRVLDSQPTYAPALFGIAETYRARGDSAQALGAYRQYLAISPSGGDAPAARRQIKELEGSGAPATSGEKGPASAARKDPDPDAPE